MELNGFHYKGNGQVYFATIYSFGEIPPYSEMGEIGFFDALPDNLILTGISLVLFIIGWIKLKRDVIQIKQAIALEKEDIYE